MITQAELLNWSPLILYGWTILHPTGAVFFVVVCEKRPLLLKLAKAMIYVGFFIGIILFGKILEAATNVLPKALGETTGKGTIFILSSLFLFYLVPALTNAFLFKAMFPQKWGTYVRLMRSK